MLQLLETINYLLEGKCDVFACSEQPHKAHKEFMSNDIITSLCNTLRYLCYKRAFLKQMLIFKTGNKKIMQQTRKSFFQSTT